MTDCAVRAAAVAEARAWIGTPYMHQASLRDAGCDCLGLVRGVYRAVAGCEPEAVAPYTPDWHEVGGPEALLAGARRWLTPQPLEAAAPGDVILFRMCSGAPLKHAAILSERTTLIHAYWGRAVVESVFGRWWRARAGAAFSFPGAKPWPN